MGPRWCHLVREGSCQGSDLHHGARSRLGYSLPHCWGERRGSEQRDPGTQPQEGGKGTPGFALWALQGLQAHGGQVPGKGHQGLTWPAH